MGEEWEKIEEKMRRAVREMEQELGTGSREKEGWWDEECRRMKKEVRRELRIWRRRGEGEKEYKEKKGRYKEICERKKRE